MEKKFKVVETLFRCGKCGNYIKAIRQYNGMKIIDGGCLEFRIFKKKMPDYEYFFCCEKCEIESDSLGAFIKIIPPKERADFWFVKGYKEQKTKQMIENTLDNTRSYIEKAKKEHKTYGGVLNYGRLGNYYSKHKSVEKGLDELQNEITKAIKLFKKGENIEELLDFIGFLSNNTLNNHKVYMSYFMQARFQFERGASNIVYHNLKHVKSCLKGIKEVMEKSKKIIV